MKDYDYQKRRAHEYLVPHTVYKQAVWAVKDLPRLKERLKEVQENAYYVGSHNLLLEGGTNGILSDTTANNAVELANISNRINAIENAFLMIPEKYRDGIRKHLINDMEFGDSAHPNTWKHWQQVYIFYTAKNLQLV